MRPFAGGEARRPVTSVGWTNENIEIENDGRTVRSIREEARRRFLTERNWWITFDRKALATKNKNIRGNP